MLFRLQDERQLLAGVGLEVDDGHLLADALQRGLRAQLRQVGARDEAGAIIGSARAISDGVKRGWIYDVIVAPAWRGRGVGQALTRLVLDHPALRATATVMLGTRDAQALYARFGFVDVATRPPRDFTTTDMVRVR